MEVTDTVRHILHVKRKTEFIIRVLCIIQNGCEYVDTLSIRVIDINHTPEAMLRYLAWDRKTRNISMEHIDTYILPKHMNWVFTFRTTEALSLPYYVYESRIRNIDPSWHVTRSMCLRQSEYKKETL